MDSLFESYQKLALSYNVSATLFIAIYLIMTPSYYYGLFKLGRAAFKYHKSCKRLKKRVSMHDLFLEKGFLRGYFINRFSWVAPYAYVIFWGKNLPLKFYLLLFSWAAIGAYIFTHNLKNKYLNSSR